MLFNHSAQSWQTEPFDHGRREAKQHRAFEGQGFFRDRPGPLLSGTEQSQQQAASSTLVSRGAIMREETSRGCCGMEEEKKSGGRGGGPRRRAARARGWGCARRLRNRQIHGPRGASRTPKEKVCHHGRVRHTTPYTEPSYLRSSGQLQSYSNIHMKPLRAANTCTSRPTHIHISISTDQKITQTRHRSRYTPRVKLRQYQIDTVDHPMTEIHKRTQMERKGISWPSLARIATLTSSSSLRPPSAPR